MKKILLLFLLFPIWLLAQTKTTQGTQIVAAVKVQKNEITTIYALATIKKDNGILKSCEECTYFLGELTGKYVEKGNALFPKDGATITVFKEHELFKKKARFPDKGFTANNSVMLGNTKATVLENKNGELILKTKNNEK